MKVKSQNGLTELRKVTVKVERGWVGAGAPEATVYSSLGSCDKGYVKGKQYFIYAELKDDRLEVTPCIPSTLDKEIINSFKLWFGEGKS